MNKRGENTLQVWLDAVALARYTMEITANKKNFPARYDEMTGRINACAINAAGDLWKANQIYVGKGSDALTPEQAQADGERLARAWSERLGLEHKAIEELNEMLFLIDLAGKVLHRPAKKTLYWANLARGVKHLAVKWRESEAKRASGRG